MTRKTKLPAGREPNPCYNAPLESREYPAEFWGLRMPFTPHPVQLTRYAEHHGHDVPLNWENDPPTPTFDDDALRDLQIKYPTDPLYPMIKKYRAVERALSTYVNGLQVGTDGRIHTEFGHKPLTLRLSSKNPAMQNWPRGDDKDSPLAKVKGMFVAAPGKKFLSRDFSGIEGVLTGYLANDKRLVQVAGGEIQDVHGFIATTAVGDPPNMQASDADIAAHLRHYKAQKDRQFLVNGSWIAYDTLRTGCKRAFYLSLYGGTPNRMVQSEPKIFPTKKIAEWYQQLIFATFPSIEKWQWASCEEAEARGYLASPDGFRLHFMNTFEYKYSKRESRWVKKISDSGRECIAAKPQHLAMTFGALALVEIWTKHPELAQGLRLMIHDDITGEWAEDQLEAADAVLKAAMEAPCPYCPLPPSWNMGTHLSIKTEAKWGTVWGDMKVKK